MGRDMPESYLARRDCGNSSRPAKSAIVKALSPAVD